MSACSDVFAVCLVFTVIVMYDACHVRREAGRHATLLNVLTEMGGGDPGGDEEDTGVEVFPLEQSLQVKHGNEDRGCAGMGVRFDGRGEQGLWQRRCSEPETRKECASLQIQRPALAFAQDHTLEQGSPADSRSAAGEVSM